MTDQQLEGCCADSEVDEESFHLELSQRKLDCAIRTRKTRQATEIYRTDGVDSGLFDRFEELLHKPLPPNDASDTNVLSDLGVSPHNVPSDAPVPSGSASSDNGEMHYGRGSRRRNISFYQQHIYTIDCVSYTLGIDTASATDLVKKNPALIEMFHEGTLPQFLKTGSVRKKKTRKNGSSNGNKDTGTYIRDMDTQDVDIQQLRAQEEEEESYSEGSEPSTDSSSSEDDEEDDNGASNDTLQQRRDSSTMDSADKEEDSSINVTFRGKTYTSIDELARVSKLPKSYFSSLGVFKTSSKRVVKKRNHLEDKRVGVARRKKIKHSAQDKTVHGFDSIFTNDSQGEDGLRELASVGEVLSDDEDIRNVHPTPALEMFDNGDEETTFYPSGITSVGYIDNDDDLETMEDRGFGGDRMLASAPRKPHVSNAKNQTRKTNRLVSTKVFKRKHNGSVSVKTSTQRKSSPDSQKRSSDMNEISKTKRMRGTSIGTMFPKSVPTRKPVVRVPLRNITESHNAAEGSKDSRRDHNSSKYYSLRPTSNSMLGRHGHMSTVVFETLADDYSVLPRKLPQRNVINIDEYNDQVDAAHIHEQTTYMSHFMNSQAYNILFKGCCNFEVKSFQAIFGKKTLKFSKLSSNVNNDLRELFDTLIDSSIITSIPKLTLIKNIQDIMVFCCDLDVTQAKSLRLMVDNFYGNLESQIRASRTIRDYELYCLASCYIFYMCVNRIFETNYLSIFDLNQKSREVFSLFFEFSSHISPGTLRRKFNEDGLFSEAVSFLFSGKNDMTWDVYANSGLKDLGLLRDLCIRFPPQKAFWRIISKSVRKSVEIGDFNGAAISLMSINEFTRLGWKIDEGILLTMYDSIKEMKFKNFPMEHSPPVILSNNGLNRDSVINLYLNLLIEFSKVSGIKPRMLERVLPVSKITSSDVVILCNRLNIILVLSFASSKNLDSRFFDLLQHHQFSTLAIQRCFQALNMLIEINNTNKFVTSMGPLTKFIESHITEKEFLICWSDFVSGLQLEKLLPKTQLSFIRVLTHFCTRREVFAPSQVILEKYISNVQDRSILVTLMNDLRSMDPSSSLKLWLTLSAKTTSAGLTNWSKLIRSYRFEDEPRIFAYIIKHSGVTAYRDDRETILISLVKNLLVSTHSPSMNAFIREVSKVDPLLLSCQNTLIQTNRLQIVLNFVHNLINNEKAGSRMRFLSFLINRVKFEFDNNGGDPQSSYGIFVRRVVEYLNIYASDYVGTSQAMETLCAIFDISKRKALLSNGEQVFRVDGEIYESVKFLQEMLISCLDKGKDFSEYLIPMIIQQPSKVAVSMNISDSKLFSLCCLISLSIESLAKFPSCWVYLHEQTRALLSLLEADRNLQAVDFFCLMKTVRLLPFMLSYRRVSFQKLERSTLVNVYELLILTFRLLDGSNDVDCFTSLTYLFTDSRVLDEPISPPYEPNYLFKPPFNIKNIIAHADSNIQAKFINGEAMNSHRCSLFDLFNEFNILLEAHASGTSHSHSIYYC
ncbi:unnamed protein product [Cyberlindnera jadinii]|uniref:Uncharacterized protein n=1 Tax=Cyberlindnera jadinii (strain ATCC 18201 / CBS 1600 / BCRC 20928 / JCM 3617 / NBRC 0987 / NRRL Y-1542) TaxID=983966 RepID=A0A0H5BYC9_CYBJN|nr:unnamed protein product [Cyberlindnera jadinii]